MVAGLPQARAGKNMGGAVLGALVGILAYVTLLERKFAARMQSRIGPYRVGPHGLLQPIADALKLMMKEDVVPRQADRRGYNPVHLVFLVSHTLFFTVKPTFPPTRGANHTTR